VRIASLFSKVHKFYDPELEYLLYLHRHLGESSRGGHDFTYASSIGNSMFIVSFQVSIFNCLRYYHYYFHSQHFQGKHPIQHSTYPALAHKAPRLIRTEHSTSCRGKDLMPLRLRENGQHTRKTSVLTSNTPKQTASVVCISCLCVNSNRPTIGATSSTKMINVMISVTTKLIRYREK